MQDVHEELRRVFQQPGRERKRHHPLVIAHDAAVALLREKNPTATIVTTPWTELDGKQILETMERRDTLSAELEHLKAEAAEDDDEDEHEHHHHHHDDDEHECCCGHHHHHDDEDDDDHEHEHEHHHDHDEHDHDHCCSHDHDHDEEYNPHVWLSVENAIKQVENIENKLIEYNSINKDKYSQNAREYIEQLSNLDNKIHSELDNIKNKNIVTFHEAFPYFAKEYGLNIVGVVQREAGSEPSAKELQETIEKIKKLDVKAICVEPQYSTKAAETISKETNVKVYTLDPIVTEESKNSSYIDIMNKNLETLKEAFK